MGGNSAEKQHYIILCIAFTHADLNLQHWLFLEEFNLVVVVGGLH